MSTGLEMQRVGSHGPQGALFIEPLALAHLKEALADELTSHGIRLAVKASGCSGYAYVLEVVDAPFEHDLCFELEGLRLWVDEEHFVKFLSDLTLVFKQEGLNQGIDFVNPRVSATCGCGESFSVDPRHENG